MELFKEAMCREELQRYARNVKEATSVVDKIASVDVAL